MKKEYKSGLAVLDVGDLGFELKRAGRMAKSKQARASDHHGPVKHGADSRIADVPAQPIDRLVSRSEVNIEAGLNAGGSIFVTADAILVGHSCGFLEVLTAKLSCRHIRLYLYRLKVSGFQYCSGAVSQNKQRSSCSLLDRIVRQRLILFLA